MKIFVISRRQDGARREALVAQLRARRLAFELVEAADGRALAEHVELRPSHTYKDNVVTWAPVTARRVKMVVEDTYDSRGRGRAGRASSCPPPRSRSARRC